MVSTLAPKAPRAAPGAYLPSQTPAQPDNPPQRGLPMPVRVDAGPRSTPDCAYAICSGFASYAPADTPTGCRPVGAGLPANPLRTARRTPCNVVVASSWPAIVAPHSPPRTPGRSPASTAMLKAQLNQDAAAGGSLLPSRGGSILASAEGSATPGSDREGLRRIQEDWSGSERLGWARRLRDQSPALVAGTYLQTFALLSG
jgi:hypothetical protein